MKKISFLFCFLFSISLCFSSSSFKNKFIVNTIVLKNTTLNASVKTTKDVYNELEEIIVSFSGLPGSKGDWITLIKPSASARDYGN